jgi:basic membrane protein A
MLASAPNGYLTSPLWNWGPFYTKTVQAVIDGTWTSEKYWGGMNDGLVTLDDFGPSVSQETKDKIATLKEEFTAGNENIFVGPIYDQNGELKVAEGVKMTDDEMWSMFFFVQGVEGTLE